MRTTLTLEDDVVALLEQFRRDGGYGFKEAVNLALRRGLTQPAEARRARPRYRTPAVDLGMPRLPSLDNVAEVLALAEGEAHR